MLRSLAVSLLVVGISLPLGAQASPAREVIGTPTRTLSPAIRIGNMVYASGQLGMRRNEADNSIGAQTRRALEATKAVLEQAGTTIENAVRCTVFLVEVADFQGMNAVYSEFWPTNPPARSTVVVKALVVPGALVEIECMAVMPAD